MRATDLHARNKRLKSQTVARVSVYPGAARVSRAGGIKSAHRGSESRQLLRNAGCNDIKKRVSSLESRTNTLLQFIEADRLR